MLSPTTEEATYAQIRDETRGKQRTEVEESCKSELILLLKEIRDEMRDKDEQLREEIR